MKDAHACWNEYERRCVPKGVGLAQRKAIRLAFCAGMLALRDAYVTEAPRPREVMMANVDTLNANLDAFAKEILTDLGVMENG